MPDDPFRVIACHQDELNEIRRRQREHLKLAVQLERQALRVLERELDCAPPWRWLYRFMRRSQIRHTRDRLRHLEPSVYVDPPMQGAP